MPSYEFNLRVTFLLNTEKPVDLSECDAALREMLHCWISEGMQVTDYLPPQHEKLSEADVASYSVFISDPSQE
jgi:hypothetical protein